MEPERKPSPTFFSSDQCAIIDELWAHLVARAREEYSSYEAINEGRVHPIMISYACAAEDWDALVGYCEEGGGDGLGGEAVWRMVVGTGEEEAMEPA